MNILRADLHVPGWCSFRIPQSINVHLCYPVPPPTTLYGMVANAMGLPQDDYSLCEDLKFGVRTLKKGSLIETYTQWQKWNPSKGLYTMLVTRQKILQPIYRMYVSGESELLKKIRSALEEPERLLYLGESDDSVEIRNIVIELATVTTHHELNSVAFAPMLKGQIPLGSHVEALPLPIRFSEAGRSNYNVSYELAFIGTELTFENPISCYYLPNSREYIVLAEEGAT